MEKALRLWATVCMALLFWVPTVWGDEIIDQIKEAISAYEAGNYSEAISSLNFATAQIQQKQSASLKEVFPKPLAGWQAGEASGEYAPAAFMGGGVSASRQYNAEADGKSVSIEILTDSPLLQSFIMIMSNPMMMGADPGTKPVKIKTYRGFQKFSAPQRSGEVNLVLQSRMLVSVKGSGIDNLDDVMAYANAIDFARLEAFLGK